MERIVVACASGQDAAAVVAPRVKDGAEVVAVMLDLGDGTALEAARDAALAAGALRAHVLDAREAFVRDYVLPSLRAGALVVEGRDMAGALRQAITMEKLAEIAALERTTRIEPPATIPAPAAHTRTTGADAPAQVDLAFERGVPAALNGVAMPPVELLDSLATIGRVHGFGEDSAMAVVQAAHDELRRAVAPADLASLTGELRLRYIDVVAAGGWHSPLRRALDAFFCAVDAHANGIVHLRLHGGRSSAVGITRTESV